MREHWLGWVSPMYHPFADLIGLAFEEMRAGYSRCTLTVSEDHMNPNGVVHGAVVYALADTGMGGAVNETLAEGEMCATIEVKINYFKPITSGVLACVAETVNRGKSVANMEARVYSGEVLVAQANGNYAIFTPRKGTA